MKTYPTAAVLGLVALLAWPLSAAAEVTVSGAWVRGTVPGQKATGAFMQLSSPADATLVGAASPIAKVVEVHEMKKEGDVMKMRAIDRLALPAGKPVELKPGGYHVMLFDLQKTLSDGDAVALTLTFEDKDGKKSTVMVKAAVRGLNQMDPQAPKR